MFFLVDTNKKFILGWTPKCGCTHIKKIFWYLINGDENNVIHKARDICALPTDIEKYITIIISRNPYERVVSGFLDKYRNNGEFRKLWKYPQITFTEFVDQILKNNWEMIHKLHFDKQTSQDFNEIILKSKKLIIYDIKFINYELIENIYGTKIPQSLLDFRGGHENNKTNILEKYVYDLDMSEYDSFKVPTKYFYNKDIKEQIYNYYYDDFIFFKNNGINYNYIN